MDSAVRTNTSISGLFIDLSSHLSSHQ